MVKVRGKNIYCLFSGAALEDNFSPFLEPSKKEGGGRTPPQHLTLSQNRWASHLPLPPTHWGVGLMGGLISSPGLLRINRPCHPKPGGKRPGQYRGRRSRQSPSPMCRWGYRWGSGTTLAGPSNKEAQRSHKKQFHFILEFLAVD